MIPVKRYLHRRKKSKYVLLLAGDEKIVILLLKLHWSVKMPIYIAHQHEALKINSVSLIQKAYIKALTTFVDTYTKDNERKKFCQ
jgi:hypothetical protein